MKALRIKLTQNSANYRREETDKNKMTYPLPPPATIIGAIHKACDFTEYHPMDISIQGKFKSMHKEAYTDYCFLNSVNNDRGILVKMNNDSFISSGFIKVAVSKKKGSNIINGIEIKICNEKLLKEYKDLLDIRDNIKDFKDKRLKPFKDIIKKRKKKLAEKKKKYKDNNVKLNKILYREKQIKTLEKTVNERFGQYKKKNFIEPYSKFRSLTTSLKYYEILDDIELIIHVRANEELLKTILDNVYNIKSIGRSEDFINVKEAKIVELSNFMKDVESKYSAYLNYDDLVNEAIYTKSILQRKGDSNIVGTKYYINKNYIYEDENNKIKRIFKKCKVVYASEYFACESSPNVFIDSDENNKYIVNFL